MDCSEARLSLGVYVLGAIDPAERALVDGHLATCRDCRDELAGLAGLPALLARVSREEAIVLAAYDAETPAVDEEPPRELLGSVIDLTAARRRRQRWRNVVMGAAAALVIAAGVFGGVSALNRPAPAPSAGQAFTTGPGGAWETASIVSPAGQGATIEYRSTGWGVQLDTKVVGIPVGTTCELWIVERNGKHLLAGSWTTDANENNVWYPSSAATSAANLRSFVVTVGKKQSINVPAS
ncbi:MAG: zf-HC2 domain-containing protein [Streptosporangiaceae bacterium]|nr:zf-HC2 domain-containing protein [Streptosporangiaceae bacterium]MBV9858239.1 zf-HC2 domain-containing protein [Streptosporangiaceae bacterium]